MLYVFSVDPTMVIRIPGVELGAQLSGGQSFFFLVAKPPVMVGSLELIIVPMVVMIAVIFVKPVISPSRQLNAVQRQAEQACKS